MAQVYKGYIKGRAEPVAIKVLHPHINESVGADLDVLRSIAAFFESFPKLKPLGPVAIVDDFRLRMVEQVSPIVQLARPPTTRHPTPYTAR